MPVGPFTAESVEPEVIENAIMKKILRDMWQQSPLHAEKIDTTHSSNMRKNEIVKNKHLAICVSNPHGPQGKLTLRKAGT